MNYKNAPADGNKNDLYIGNTEDDVDVFQENPEERVPQLYVDNNPDDAAFDQESESGNYDALHNINKLMSNDDDVINEDKGAVYTNVDINLDYEVSSRAQFRLDNNYVKSAGTIGNHGVVAKEDAKAWVGGRQTIQALPESDGDTNVSGDVQPTTVKKTVEGNTHIENIGVQTIQAFGRARTMKIFAKNGGSVEVAESTGPIYDGHESVMAFVRVDETNRVQNQSGDESSKRGQGSRIIRHEMKQTDLSMETISFDRSMRNVAKMQVDTGVFKRSDNEVVNNLDMGHSGFQTIQAFADITQKQMNDKKKDDTVKSSMRNGHSQLYAAANGLDDDVAMTGTLRHDFSREMAGEHTWKMGPETNMNLGTLDRLDNTNLILMGGNSDGVSETQKQDVDKTKKAYLSAGHVNDYSNGYLLYPKAISVTSNVVVSTKELVENDENTTRKTHR